MKRRAAETQEQREVQGREIDVLGRAKIWVQSTRGSMRDLKFKILKDSETSVATPPWLNYEASRETFVQLSVIHINLH